MEFWKFNYGFGFVFCLSSLAEGRKLTKIIALPDKTVSLGENVRPKSGLEYSYPTAILLEDLYQRDKYNTVYKERNYPYSNHPIFAFGVENFLSYAAHFCRHEGRNGTVEVVSVGSGNGTIEDDIIATYANLFGEQLSITLIDKNPKYRVHFRTVKDLVEERSNTIRNCVLLIIYPELEQRNDGYDIQAIRKLQPRAVLTMYETSGISGSCKFRACLDPSILRYHFYHETCRLRNYAIEEIAYMEVNIDPGPASMWNVTWVIPPGEAGLRFRLVKLERTN